MRRFSRRGGRGRFSRHMGRGRFHRGRRRSFSRRRRPSIRVRSGFRM